jgi:hypothetical protein
MATYTAQQLGITAPAGGFQQGGWYQGRQFFNNTFSDPGVIHPESSQVGAGQAAGSPINKQSDVQQNKPVGTIDAYLASLKNPGAGGAGAPGAGGTYGSILSSLTGLTPDQQAYVDSEQGVLAGYNSAATGLRSQEPLVRQTYKALADQLDIQQQQDTTTAQRVGQTNVGKAEAYLANQGMEQAGGSLAEPVATAQADLSDALTKISDKYNVNRAQLTAQMNQDIATLEQKAYDYELQGQQAQADAVKEVITIKQEQERINKSYATSTIGRKDSLISAIQGGMTLKQAIANFSDTLTTSQIYDLYNIHSPYGQAKETPAQLQQLGISPSQYIGKVIPVSNLSTADKTALQKAKSLIQDGTSTRDEIIQSYPQFAPYL